MNEQKNNGRGIFYGVIGVATLVVAIIGATFAYFTATQSVNNVITGNMATVSLNLAVEQVTFADVRKGGLIPMSNSMVEPSVNDDENEVCVDDNGNAVCQVYKITINNNSSAAQFVDGYVALRGGSGKEPTDIKLVSGYSYVDGAKFDALGNANNGTTMRWAQVFYTEDGGKYNTIEEVEGVNTEVQKTEDLYTTTGNQRLGAENETVGIAMVANTSGTNAVKAHNIPNIRTTNTVSSDGTGILGTATIAGTEYDVINTNFIRTSNHTWAADNTTKETYKRTTDMTSALVYNHSLTAGQSFDYYIVVWLSETGTDQTPNAQWGTETEKNPAPTDFFIGDVTFKSAQGSEVSATFSGYTKVASQTVQS